VFDHVTIRVSDRVEAERFYETVLAALGRRPTSRGEAFTEWEDFSLAASDGRPTRHLHVGFAAHTHGLVDASWKAGTAAGFRSDGEPGPRTRYGSDYYGGFLLDPDGNSAEAVNHGSLRTGGVVDHLWIRVADLAAARDFYTLVGRFAGFGLEREVDDPPRAQFASGNGSFSVVDDGAPAANVHVAFAAPDDATVGAFHAAATAAGYRSNGTPGERALYHPGYYAAYIRDPDGNNIELVNHNR
jgi:catechol 2,3-dioxygenase-like lactoylglutathione lyase family enzyme